MSRTQEIARPCPLCERITRAHSRIELSDVAGGGLPGSCYATVICRDCAFAMVVRAEAQMLRSAM